MPGVAGAGGSGPGAKPGDLPTVSAMADRGQGLSPREAFIQGVGKAHRQVVYAHYDFRNFDRSYLGDTGRVTE